MISKRTTNFYSQFSWFKKIMHYGQDKISLIDLKVDR